jgi:hypothetical protein
MCWRLGNGPDVTVTSTDVGLGYPQYANSTEFAFCPDTYAYTHRLCTQYSAQCVSQTIALG